MRAGRAWQHHPRQPLAFECGITLADGGHAHGLGRGIGQRHHPQVLDAIALIIAAVRHHALRRGRQRSRLHGVGDRLLDFFVALLLRAQPGFEVAARRERLVVAAGEAVGHARLALDEVGALAELLARARGVVGHDSGAGPQILGQDLHRLRDLLLHRRCLRRGGVRQRQRERRRQDDGFHDGISLGR